MHNSTFGGHAMTRPAAADREREGVKPMPVWEFILFAIPFILLMGIGLCIGYIIWPVIAGFYVAREVIADWSDNPDFPRNRSDANATPVTPRPIGRGEP